MQRKISDCEHIFKTTNCILCGLYLHQNSAIKTCLYNTTAHLNSHQYLKHMRKKMPNKIVPTEISESTNILLSAICDKFVFKIETQALALYIYQKLREMHTNEKFWVCCCLIVASKGIQLDRNVPYLNRYQRYAEKMFSQQDYEMAEKSIFDSMNFDIQFPTFITFLHFYLTNGIIFREDKLNPAIVQLIEDDVLSKSRQMLKRAIFTKYDQQKLACSIIRESRQSFGLLGWNKDLQTMTEVEVDNIIPYESAQVLKINNQNNILKTHKILNLKNMCIRKKFDTINLPQIRSQSTKKNLSAISSTKENSQSIVQTNILSAKGLSDTNPTNINNFNVSCDKSVSVNKMMDCMLTKRKL